MKICDGQLDFHVADVAPKSPVISGVEKHPVKLILQPAISRGPFLPPLITIGRVPLCRKHFERKNIHGNLCDDLEGMDWYAKTLQVSKTPQRNDLIQDMCFEKSPPKKKSSIYKKSRVTFF